jgi:hypothetical protein
MKIIKATFNRLKEKGSLLLQMTEQRHDVAKVLADYLAWPSD